MILYDSLGPLPLINTIHGQYTLGNRSDTATGCYSPLVIPS